MSYLTLLYAAENNINNNYGYELQNFLLLQDLDIKQSTLKVMNLYLVNFIHKINCFFLELVPV